MTEKETELVNAFKDIEPALKKWAGFVDQHIIELLVDFKDDNSLKIQPEFRLKTHKSFLSKALYRKKQYDDPLLEIEDKVGTRVVLLKSEDVYKAADVLIEKGRWCNKITKDIRKIILDKEKEFDYQSFHLVVWPVEEDDSFTPEVKPFLTCEIQIRTLLQHAFAEVSHDSTYKGPYRNDKQILRKLSKSMALMESTDDYFCEIYKMMTETGRLYRNYLQELTKLYQELKPGKTESDIDLADIIFSLLEFEPVSVDAMSEFIQKDEPTIKEAITANNSLIFNQPIILLIGYYIFEKQTFIKDKWPLSQDVLKECVNGFGFSFGHY